MSTLTQPAQPPEPAAVGYEQETGSSSKKRLVGVGIAVALHALLIYGFTSGLASDIVQKVQKTVNVSIVPESKPPPPPPPPEPVEEIEADSRPRQPQQRAPTKAFVPKAEVQTKQTSADTISGVTDKVEEATPAIEKAAPVVQDAPPAKAAGPAKTMARLMKGCRLPQYPKRSEDKGEEGVTVLRFLVGTDGSVQTAQLVSSSGFERLDNAAREAFMKCKFTPGTVDGAVVTSWVRQPFTWRLK